MSEDSGQSEGDQATVDHLRTLIPMPGQGPVPPGANPFLLAAPQHAAVSGQNADLSARLSQLDGLLAAARAAAARMTPRWLT
jgi:hypothetical protein